LAVWMALRAGNALAESKFLRIQDPPSRYTSVAHELLQRRADELSAVGFSSDQIQELKLFATDSEIVTAVDQFIAVASSDILLDISCLPKRIFFPFVRRLMESPKVHNLLVAYTVPEAYGAVLAEDHQALQCLPLFGPAQFPEPQVEVAFIGVGFHPLGLPDLLAPYKQHVAVRLFMPFPPGPPSFQRNWRFIGELRKSLPPHAAEPVRVGAYDVPDVFEHILRETNEARRYAIFAPYGPKPQSLAMCIYAAKTHSPVFYTQPTVYDPRYSTGIKMIGSEPETYVYCIKCEGRDFYEV
jgi:hypothetical protein